MLRRFTLLNAMHVFKETIPHSALVFKTENIVPKGTLVLVEEIDMKIYDNRDRLVLPFEHDKQDGFLLTEELSIEAEIFSNQWGYFHKECLWGKSEYQKREAMQKRDAAREKLEKLLRDLTRPDLRLIAGKDAVKV